MPVIGSYSDGEMARHRVLLVGEAEVDKNTGAIIRINDSSGLEFPGFVGVLVRRIGGRFAVSEADLVADQLQPMVVCAACGESAALAGESVCGACLEELMAGGPAWR